MDLNEAQNKAISEFHSKFGHEDASGHLKPEAHLSDIRRLVEVCVQLEKENTTQANNKGGE
jgi:hypothetical protein